jgi:hypothetical protein
VKELFLLLLLLLFSAGLLSRSSSVDDLCWVIAHLMHEEAIFFDTLILLQKESAIFGAPK